MHIKFVRSGGFAGPATRVEGEVSLKEDAAEVVSPVANYKRALSPREVETLERCASPPESSAPASPGPVRDGYQYDIFVETGNGQRHEFTVHPDGRTTNQGNIQGDLAAWVQQEAQKIWKQRIQNR